MERLQQMLVQYNSTLPRESHNSWSVQFFNSEFPSYWRIVYSLMSGIERNLHIVEIGCGQGDITSVLCYLGFTNIVAYERDLTQAQIAAEKIEALFHRNDVVKTVEYNGKTPEKADVMILVNCVYADGLTKKEEYLNQILTWYNTANRPKYLIMECIDDSYAEEDIVFPMCVRTNINDIVKLFPKSHIDIFPTYRYPTNKKSKNLYFITNPI